MADQVGLRLSRTPLYRFISDTLSLARQAKKEADEAFKEGKNEEVIPHRPKARVFSIPVG